MCIKAINYCKPVAFLTALESRSAHSYCMQNVLQKLASGILQVTANPFGFLSAH